MVFNFKWFFSVYLSLLFSLTAFADKDRDLVAFARTLGATHDIDWNVKAILENDLLKNACDRHFNRLDKATDKLADSSLRDPQHISDMLRCGKWIFISADFPSKLAIPEAIIRGLMAIFPEETGQGMHKLGMIENPYEPGLPIGMAKLSHAPWGILNIATGAPLGITCAACHVGQMPDGRYAIGMPNQNLEFGKLSALILYSAWRADFEKHTNDSWPSQLNTYYRGLDKQLNQSFSRYRALFDTAQVISWLKATTWFYGVTGVSRPIASETATFLSALPNRYYASSPILPVEGLSYYMSAPQIWELANYQGDYDRGEARPISNFSPVKHAEDFIALAYIFQTGNADIANSRYIDPLLLYLRSLKTPPNLEELSAESIKRGEQLFQDHCVSCHNGPHGESLMPSHPSETQSPLAIVDPLEFYLPPHELAKVIYETTVDKVGYPLTIGGIHSRRLKGIYARKQLMINGGVDDLEHAFCLNGPRGEQSSPFDPLTDGVHLDLCLDYTEDEKRDLVSFLKSWF